MGRMINANELRRPKEEILLRLGVCDRHQLRTNPGLRRSRHPLGSAVRISSARKEIAGEIFVLALCHAEVFYTNDIADAQFLIFLIEYSLQAARGDYGLIK